MPKSKKQFPQRDLLPENFDSLEEFWAFWDTHSTADYEDFMEDVDVQINLRSSKMYCAVEKDLITQLRTQARQEGVSTETLINLWLREKVTEATQSKWGDYLMSPDKAEYIDTGKFRHIFRDLPLDLVHPQARKAADATHGKNGLDPFSRRIQLAVYNF